MWVSLFMSLNPEIFKISSLKKERIKLCECYLIAYNPLLIVVVESYSATLYSTEGFQLPSESWRFTSVAIKGKLYMWNRLTFRDQYCWELIQKIWRNVF